jgi:DNA-binding transcriptional LysR family regulator
MDLSDLVIFRAVAREGGIVRAARVLHRVQSNVTTRIKQLEESVGAQLFHRDRQRLHLSPDGERLLAYADRLLQLADEARAAVGNGPPRGILRLGALESTSASRLPAILSAFHARYAEVGVELTTGTNDALIEGVAGRRLDAAFVAETPGDQRFAHAPMFRERLVLITSLAHRPVRHALDVADETVIAFPNGCAYRRVIQRWLGERGLQAVRTLELGSYHAIVACVASGTGIAVMPESVLETVRSAEVARHSLPKVLGEIITPMVWRTGEETPAAAALRALARTMTRGGSRR